MSRSQIKTQIFYCSGQPLSEDNACCLRQINVILHNMNKQSYKGPCKGTQQVTTLLDPTMLGVVDACWHMQTNATTANNVGVSSLFWP